MNKSPIDNLFFELMGYYPEKAGQAYEMLVAAVFKLIREERIALNQYERGLYSKTNYQIDVLLQSQNERQMAEAKDYTLGTKKVGRSDLQKLQGALADLPYESGIFASATDYTEPAKKYATLGYKSHHQKKIELFHIRPSQEIDEEGRLKRLVFNSRMVFPDYTRGEFKIAWTEEAKITLIANGYGNKMIPIEISKFFLENGQIDCMLSDYTRINQPHIMSLDDECSIGCWLLHGKYIKLDGILYRVKGLEYKIPLVSVRDSFTVEADGKPKIIVKSEDGKIDKLLTDEDLRRVIQLMKLENR